MKNLVLTTCFVFLMSSSIFLTRSLAHHYSWQGVDVSNTHIWCQSIFDEYRCNVDYKVTLTVDESFTGTVKINCYIKASYLNQTESEYFITEHIKVSNGHGQGEFDEAGFRFKKDEDSSFKRPRVSEVSCKMLIPHTT